MFVSLPANEITRLVQELDTDQALQSPFDETRWWGLVELPVAVPWFFISVRRDDGDEDGHVLVSDPGKFCDIVREAASSIKRITMAVPPDMSGMPDWCFETLASAWDGRCQRSGEPVWVFETDSGKNHLLASTTVPGRLVERLTKMYSAA